MDLPPPLKPWMKHPDQNPECSAKIHTRETGNRFRKSSPQYPEYSSESAPPPRPSLLPQIQPPAQPHNLPNPPPSSKWPATDSLATTASDPRIPSPQILDIPNRQSRKDPSTTAQPPNSSSPTAQNTDLTPENTWPLNDCESAPDTHAPVSSIASSTTTNSAHPANPLPEPRKTNTPPPKQNPLHWPHPACHSSPNAHLWSYDSHAPPPQIPTPPPAHTESNALPKAYDNSP